METQVKKRTWVKDVAIIFLVILLVLTFFSRTILNASLTEVATQEVKSGPITAKVRGTGKVVANGSNKVKSKGTVTIAKVMIKNGEEVEVGDVLFVLGAGDSAELESAKNTLFDLEAAYDSAVANLPLSGNYASEQATIKARQREVELAEENLRIAQSSQSTVDDDSEKNELVQKQLDLQKQIADETKEYQTLNNEYTKLKTIINDRESYYSYVQNAYETQNAIAIAESGLETAKSGYELAQKNLEDAQSKYEAAKGTENEAAALSELKAAKSFEETAKKNLDDAQSAYDTAMASPAKNGITEADVADAKKLLQEAQDDYKAWCGKKVRVKTSGENVEVGQFERLNSLNEIVQNHTAELNAISSKLEVWNAGTGYNLKIAQAESDLAAAKDNLYVAQSNLQTAVASDGKTANAALVTVNAAKERVERQKEKIKELSGEGDDKTITATAAGTVTEINCSSGDTVVKDDILAVIEVKDMGYTVSFSVTNDQARRLKVGDEGTISNFYWGNDIKAKLVSIATDKTDPQNKKTLTFDLEGDVTAGSELTVSVGQKSANYDLVVPNSAIRNDNNGKFVLVLTSKNSPLGNKYIAKRVTVDVIAEDDNNSAVNADLNRGDFVITTSAAPIKSGDQVRLTDSTT